MLATVGCIVQEAGVHPLHPEIGGLAITHMKQLALLPNDQTIVGNMFSELGMNIGTNEHLLRMVVPFYDLTLFGVYRVTRA